MKVHFFSASILAVAMASIVVAETTIVDDNFDSYGSTADFEMVWTPDLGQGDQPTPDTKGVLVPDTGAGLDPPNDDPPGIQGKAINILGNINEYNGPNSGLMENLVPSATESIFLSGDLFDDASRTVFDVDGETVLEVGSIGNKRGTIGLRNDTVPREMGFNPPKGWNFVEMGMYTDSTFDPEDPDSAVGDVPSTGYGYRLVLFGAVGGTLTRNPNWQYFALDPVLDVAGAASGDADFDGDGDRDGDDFLIWQRNNGAIDQIDNSNGDANDDGTVDDADLGVWEGQFGRPPGSQADGLVNGLDIGPGWHNYTATITPTDVTLTFDLFRDGVKNLTRDQDGNIEVGVGDPGVDAMVHWLIVPHDDPTEPNPFDPFTSLRFGAPSGATSSHESVVDNILLKLVDVDVANITSVPEPATGSLVLLSIGTMLFARRRIR